MYDGKVPVGSANMGSGATRAETGVSTGSGGSLKMLPIIPKTFDNSYRGQWLAIPFVALAALMKIAMSVSVILNTRFVVETADKIPLAHYGADAVQVILFLFQAWAVGHLLLALLAVLVLIRYRSMIPLATLLLLVEQLGRRVLLLMNPLPGVPHGDWSSMGFLINQGLLAALVIGLVLSLWKRAGAKT